MGSFNSQQVHERSKMLDDHLIELEKNICFIDCSFITRNGSAIPPPPRTQLKP